MKYAKTCAKRVGYFRSTNARTARQQRKYTEFKARHEKTPKTELSKQIEKDIQEGLDKNT
jgi:hypothetical protein